MKKEDYITLYSKRVQETFKLDPQVKITLKGQEYSIEFNNFAVKGILKDTAVNLLTDSLEGEQLGNPEFIGALLYWGLATNHPELTKEGADKLCTLQHLFYIRGQIRQALELFMPDMSDVSIDPDEIKESDSEEPRDPQ